MSAADGKNLYFFSPVQCSDTAWPSSWPKIVGDNWTVYARAPFETWGNAWFNGPCTNWPGHPGKPVQINGSRVSSALLIDETLDAATPFPGSLEVRKLFPHASLIAEPGGTTHADSLFGDTCVDGSIADYLATGALPRRQRFAPWDKTCAPLPQPNPAPQASAASVRAAVAVKAASSQAAQAAQFTRATGGRSSRRPAALRSLVKTAARRSVCSRITTPACSRSRLDEKRTYGSTRQRCAPTTTAALSPLRHSRRGCCFPPAPEASTSMSAQPETEPEPEPKGRVGPGCCRPAHSDRGSATSNGGPSQLPSFCRGRSRQTRQSPALAPTHQGEPASRLAGSQRCVHGPFLPVNAPDAAPPTTSLSRPFNLLSAFGREPLARIMRFLQQPLPRYGNCAAIGQVPSPLPCASRVRQGRPRTQAQVRVRQGSVT